MVMGTDVAHEDAHLAVVDLAPVATQLAFHPQRMRAAFGETARIEGDDAIGLAQAIGDLSHQHLDQRAMIPRGRPDACLQDLSFDIDACGNVLGIPAWHVGQQSLKVEVYVALAGLGLQHVLIRHHELCQTVNHRDEDIRGHETIAQRSYWIPGSYAPALYENRNSFLRLLKNKGFKEERMTKVGLYALGSSTTLESNKSH